MGAKTSKCYSPHQISFGSFQTCIRSAKWSEIWAYVFLNISGKPYMASPMTLSHLTLSDLESQYQGHLDIKGLYLGKQPYISQRSRVRPHVTIRHQ